MKKTILLIVSLLFVFSTAYADVADYAGTYAGTYTGDDRGIFRAIVETDGTLEAISWSTLVNMANWGVSTIDADGNFIASAAYWDYVYTGHIDASGNFTGTYYSASEGASGTFTAERVSRDSISQYIGDYAGVYAGDDSGTWEGTVYADGRMISSDGAAAGGIGPDGKFIVINDVDTGFYGIIDGDGDVTGYWHNPFYGTQGTITGQRVTEDNTNNTSSAAGGGGGGCFLNTAIQYVLSH